MEPLLGDFPDGSDSHIQFISHLTVMQVISVVGLDLPFRQIALGMLHQKSREVIAVSPRILDSWMIWILLLQNAKIQLLGVATIAAHERPQDRPGKRTQTISTIIPGV
jgi:hypothetical protein